MLPQRGHRTPCPFATGREPSLGGFGGSDFGMANASLMRHRLPTKTDQLQSLHIPTETKHASVASSQALPHRSSPGSTQSSRSTPQVLYWGELQWALLVAVEEP